MSQQFLLSVHLSSLRQIFLPMTYVSLRKRTEIISSKQRDNKGLSH